MSSVCFKSPLYIGCSAIKIDLPIWMSIFAYLDAALWLMQVIVNGMRVRIKLDEERVAELIKDTEPSAIPGLLQHLGNVASLSFTPYQNGQYQFHL